MHISIGLLYLSTLIHVASALFAGRFCPLACDLTLNYATFNDTDAWLSKKVRSCRSEPRITSLYLCFAEYCADDGETEKWIEDQSPWCDEHAGVTLPPYHDVVDRWTSDERAGLRKLEAEVALSYPVLNEVVVPEEHFFNRAFTTLDVAFHQYDLHLVYGWYMYYFWIAVATIGISTRLVSLIRNLEHQRRYQPVATHEPGYVTSKRRGTTNLLEARLKRVITVPATFGNRCSQPYGWCTIPPRIQSLTILLFVLLNIALCTCTYQLTDGNLYWPEKSTQLLRYVSDRTGIISLANFPIVWLFGMRNDVLIWITGWGFGTYNAFHRWVARVATLQAVVHSLGYTVMILQSGGWDSFAKYWTKHYFVEGEVATIAMCALLAFSLCGIRRAHYEIFLGTHIVLSMAVLWAMYQHVEIFPSGEWNIFIWPCVYIWILDRVLRAARILAFDRRFWNPRATVSFDPASNLVRMDVDGSRNWIKPQPGSYYYIHVLDDVLYAHQNHPFTLAYTTSSSRPSLSRTSSSESDSLLTPQPHTNNPPSSTCNSNLVFLIRPYDGFTSRLKSHCLLHPRTLRVLIDGPYGNSEPLHLFPHTLFIVGGTGIAVPLSHLSRLLSPSSTTQRVKIVWAVREHAFLASVLRDFAGLLGDECVDMEVHVTQEREVLDEVLDEEVKSVRVLGRRPDVCGIVEETAREARRERLAVVACGPASMADAARAACVEVLGRGYGGVEYFEESFKW